MDSRCDAFRGNGSPNNLRRIYSSNFNHPKAKIERFTNPTVTQHVFLLSSRWDVCMKNDISVTLYNVQFWDLYKISKNIL